MKTFPSKENKNIEFKEKLSYIHLKKEKRQHLATQLKYLLEIGKGEAIYILGISDKGKPVGISEIELQESLNILNIIAKDCNAEIKKVERFLEDGNLIAKILIVQKSSVKDRHIIIATCGHVNHGKSTLIATLMRGVADKDGKAWLFLDTLPHEIERGLSAELHYAFIGFKEDGTVIRFKNPLDKKERSRILEQSKKVVSFIDTVGHEPWIRTTIRGLVGQNIDYSILTISAEDGITHITKEHLGILLGLNIKPIICITKIDKVTKKKLERIEEEVDLLLKNVGKVPFILKKFEDISLIIDKLETIVPILKVSSKTLEGYDFLERLLFYLPEIEKDKDKPFLMYIDKVYNISGVGTVVSGTIKQGSLFEGKELLLGPDKSGKFKKVKIKSIEMHYSRISEAKPGFLVGIAVKGVKFDEVERGMIICEKSLNPKPVKKFEAEVLVLHHPTRISNGYEPVYHCNTISQTVKIKLLDKEYLKTGETGRVLMSFKYKPEFIQVGDKFVFREGRTKGIGSVKRIVEVVS